MVKTAWDETPQFVRNKSPANCGTQHEHLIPIYYKMRDHKGCAPFIDLAICTDETAHLEEDFL